MHYCKRGSWELQCRWKWRNKVVIRPRYIHVAVAVPNANFEITVHTGAVLYCNNCAITAKKKVFLELQCRWRWSDDHLGNGSHAP